jgi:hypothetical protein
MDETDPLKRLRAATKQMIDALEAMPEAEFSDSEIQLLAWMYAALDYRAYVLARATLEQWRQGN